jgi:GT2 family glycosyltransferase/glycosyltransferase involved in cell wall biosynthesis
LPHQRSSGRRPAQESGAEPHRGQTTRAPQPSAPPAPGATGSLDSTRWEAITGWAFDPRHPEARISITVLHQGKVLLQAVADQFRDDLRERGMGDGSHGFRLVLQRQLFAEPRVVLHIVCTDTGQELEGSPFQLANDQMMLVPETLGMIEGAITTLASGATHPDELRDATAFFLRQFDRLFQRQAALAGTDRARHARFRDLIGGEGLSELLRQAADAAVSRYTPLHLEEAAQPEVTVVIPVHNKFDYTHRCLDSMLLHPPQVSFEVVVVDDLSTDETLYASMILSGGIRILRNSRNLGFVGSVNAGAAAARGRRLLFLNNDTEVTPGWLDELWDSFERDPAIGIAGSKLLFPDGTLQEAGGLVWRMADAWNWGRNQDPARPEYCYMRDADYVSGAALMVDAALFREVGALSAEFMPAYYEDTDLCFKVRAAGRRVVVQPYSRIVHHEGVSSGTDVAGSGMKRFQRVHQRKFLTRWDDVLRSHRQNGEQPELEAERHVRKRALFIDETVPTPNRDAGSNAAFAHMLGLQRIGYAVHFVPADNMARISPYTDALEKRGIRCHYAPFAWSVEEIMRRDPTQFDVVYLHRLSNARKYMAMARARYPAARIVYNVADLHHVRAARQAEIEDSAPLRRDAAEMREQELSLIRQADTVIVHSSHERALLAEAAPETRVRVIPWTVNMYPPTLPFAQRSGLAFLGGYNHPPNQDAARFLVEQVMPLVWETHPAIELRLIGSDMPDSIRALAAPGVQALGYVNDLASVLGSLRLTAAPLRYGAGLKGKLLTSLAHGLPCVATPCAAEGAELPAGLLALVDDTPQGLAARIVRLHQEPAANAAASRLGLAWVAQTCSAGAVDALLREAVD